MTFVKKTSAQIKAMTDAEFDTYTAEKEAHEAQVAEAKVKTAVETELKAKLPDAVKAETESLTKEIDTLKTANTTIANAMEAIKETAKGSPEDPLATIKQDEIDTFNADVAKGTAKMKVTLKVATTMLVSTNVSGNTNFNMIMEPGIARAPIPMPLMARIADVRRVANPGNNGIPTVGWVNKVNMDGNAAVTAEGALKPLRDFDIVGETMTAVEVAVRTNVGKYALRDVGELRQTIEIDLREEMNRELDDQYLEGSGAGSPTEMKGVTEYASAYTDTSLNASVEDANDLDAIIAAALQIELLSWEGPLTAVVNPVTYAQIYTFKGLKHRDLVVVTERNGQLYVNNILLIKSVKIDAGYILIGDMSKSHVRIIDDIEVEAGYGASTDDFNKNLITIRADARALHFVKSVETSAIIYDSLATIKAAILAA